MADEITDPPKNRPHYGRVLIALAIVVVLALLVIALVNGMVEEYDETDQRNDPGQQQESATEEAPAGTTEPSNPNVTGGESGAGTGESNDTSTPPTPAGGVDTNNQQTP